MTQWIKARPWVADLVLALLVAVPAGASTVSLLADADTGITVVLVATAVALHATVAIRRVAPVAAFVVAAVAEAVLVASPLVPVDAASGRVEYSPVLLPSSVVFLLVLYAVVAFGPPPVARPAFAAALVGALAVTVRLGAGADVVDGVGPVAGAGLGVAAAAVAAWTLGLLRRVQGEQSEQLRAERERAAVRAERDRIARDLHDVVSHSLAVMVRQADAGRFVVRTDADAAAEVLATVADTGRAALGDMRALLGVLRTDGPAEQAPAPTTADIDALAAGVREAGHPVSVRHTGTRRPLSAATELAAFRTVQEALTNVVKHSGSGASVEVVLQWQPTELTVTVRDDGGHARRGPVAPGGHGLDGLRERVRLVGGDVEAALLGDGFELSAHLPVDR
ncbi:sensor histidine kinase [Jatrophihabitans fulvus]